MVNQTASGSASAVTQCPYCNTENLSGATACVFCGRALSLAGGPVPTSNRPAAIPTPSTPAPPPPLAADLPFRREPTLDDVPAAPSRIASTSGDHRQAPVYEPPVADAGSDAADAAPPAALIPDWYREEPRSGSGWWRALALCAVFLLGVACGAGSLWLHQHPEGVTRALAYWQNRSQPATASTGKAISAGELPYDGRTPATGMAAAAATAQTTPPTASTPSVALASRTAPPATVLPSPPSTDGKKAGATGGKPATAAAAPERPAATPSGRSRDAPALARNDAEDDGARSEASRERTLTPLMIAQCESMSDANERALCKREVCYGKWGRYGCPSYSGARIE